jgi:serine/threonine protein kinase
VLVSLDGPRVIDFGVARAAERIQLTVTRGAVGTPAYMAPEQARDTRQATMASDVFSLGATVLFAASGHAPYQGETVMDVLVRLATDPPDLTGLPPELADIVRECLERDPRKRPNSAAVLARVAPDVSLADTGRDPGSSALPGPALALIAEYRRDPKLSAERGPEASIGEGATFGSQPVLSVPRGGVGKPAGRRRHWMLLAAFSVAAAAALIGAGAAGFAVANSGRPPPPPPSSGVVVVPNSQAQQASARQGGKLQPQIAFYQTFGDSHTVFVLHGVGWVPGQPITVTLAGVGASPEHPIVDRAGTFSYAINQAHEFFRGAMPTGTYHVVVTAPGGARAGASFAVQPPPPPGPTSTTGPPGGSTTPGP